MRDSRIGIARRVLRRGRSDQAVHLRESCAALDFFAYLIMGVGNLLVAQAMAPQPPAGPPAAAAPAPGGGHEKVAANDRPLPWYIILDSPRDIDALWQRINHPDLMLIKPDQLAAGQAGSRGRQGRGNGAVAGRSCPGSGQSRRGFRQAHGRAANRGEGSGAGLGVDSP